MVAARCGVKDVDAIAIWTPRHDARDRIPSAPALPLRRSPFRHAQLPNS
jgi:hypothetical protein